MDEAVDVFITIIAIGIAIGAIITIFSYSKEDVKRGSLGSSLEILRYKCDAACASTPGTSMGMAVEIPSGIRLYTSSKKICAAYTTKQGEDAVNCEICKCNLEESEVLDLTSETAQEVFDTREYYCQFEKGVDAQQQSIVRMSCKS